MTKKSYGKFYVYTLKDPDTLRIFYVGRSKSPNSRLIQHKSEAQKFKTVSKNKTERLYGIVTPGNEDVTGNEKKLKWINSINQRGKNVIFEIIDQWTVDTLTDANRLEEAWIAHYKSLGHPLTNVVTSHRMDPSWYGPTNPKWREGWARNPQEYIQMLKDGRIGKKRKEENRPLTQKQRKRLNKISRRIQARKKKK